MADLIDRDALLKDMGLTDAVKYGNKNAEQQYHSYSTLMLYEIADSIWDAPAVNRWIPCSERMPEENVYVIAWAKRKHHSRAIMAILINGIWKIGVNDCSDGFHVQGEITHWMPLPEPPKEGEENACH